MVLRKGVGEDRGRKTKGLDTYIHRLVFVPFI